MFQLIALGVLLLGIIGGIAGFTAHERTIGADRQKAKDAPVMAVCEALKFTRAEDCAAALTAAIADRDNAMRANKALQASLADLGQQLTVQNAAALEYKDASDRLQRYSHELAERAIATGASLQADRDSAMVKSRVALLKTESCEKTLADLDADMREVAVREAKDRPAGAK